MGNNASREQQASSRASSTSAPQSPADHRSASTTSGIPRRDTRGRDSVQALSTAKSTAAPATASLASATANLHSAPPRPQPPRRTSSHQHSHSQPISHAHTRSKTAGAPSLPPLLRPTSAQGARARASPTLEKMGNSSSKQPDKEREREREPVSREPTPQLSTQQVTPPSPVTLPVDVPGGPAAAELSREKDVSPIDPDAQGLQEQYHLPPSQFSRPPRLPLPIDEESHAPGSPIISPADVSSPIDPLEVDGALPRRTSVLSSTTVDEDEDVGDEIYPQGGVGPAVPTVVEWRGPGKTVYVTGTFVNWERKYKLLKDGPSKHKDALSTTLNLQPGTHHLKFLVDGEMMLSNELPTTVDYTNVLMNYLEVAPEPPAGKPSEPVAIPSRHESSEPEARSSSTVVPPGVFPPQILPPTPEIRPTEPTAPPTPIRSSASAASGGAPLEPTNPKRYTQTMPAFLLDLDAPEDSHRFQRASAVLASLPTPPSLPMFLNKSILNGNTPMKDDSSVLVMPNHTVLNHLATSSIKNNVLATSATTRYKRKFLTTIMYKPTNEVGD
ncbi:galactose metabolism- protein [Coniosporium apollinis]|uniref:Galactose metabolism- protein n=1 Tax=Coniosporium apollinis TaxID=61459 RepID=A0ABQ9NHT0_9PEZI|nr:galactose metabolism- protein [Coniosporium apollinis]